MLPLCSGVKNLPSQNPKKDFQSLSKETLACWPVPGSPGPLSHLRAVLPYQAPSFFEFPLALLSRSWLKERHAEGCQLPSVRRRELLQGAGMELRSSMSAPGKGEPLISVTWSDLNVVLSIMQKERKGWKVKCFPLSRSLGHFHFWMLDTKSHTP